MRLLGDWRLDLTGIAWLFCSLSVVCSPGSLGGGDGGISGGGGGGGDGGGGGGRTRKDSYLCSLS